MSGWSDWIFGNLPPQPSRPASRGALLGMNYQAMPDASEVEDRRPEGIDYTVGMRRHTGDDTGAYWPTDIKGADPWGSGQFRGYDPLIASPLIAARGVNTNTPGAYSPSFQQKFRPRQSSFPVGPNLPSPSSGSDLPYMGAHLPWAPGDPAGWTPPPSPSGAFTPEQLNAALRAWGGWQ